MCMGHMDAWQYGSIWMGCQPNTHACIEPFCPMKVNEDAIEAPLEESKADESSTNQCV